MSLVAIGDCPHEVQTLAAAEQEAGYAPLVSSDPAADANHISTICSPGGDQVTIRFASGVGVMTYPNSIPNPPRSWQRYVEDNPGEGDTAEVLGETALRLSPGPGAKGSITLVHEGLYVSVVGNGQLDLDQLTQIADSLHPYSA
jgi:hypothetical protein